VKFQRVKLIHGADGVNAGDVSTANALPTAVQTALPAGTNNIGDVDVLSLPALAAGTNNIGDVDVLSVVPGTGAADLGKAEDAAHASGDTGVMALAVRKDTAAALAGADGDYAPLEVDASGRLHVVRSAATTDSIGVAAMTNVINDGLTALTPKYAVIDAATSGDNTLVAAVASKKIRVLALFAVAAAAVAVRFESGASGTALTGQMNLAANGGFVLPFNPVGWFETASNTLLNMELGGAVSVDGSLVYVEV